MLIAPREATTEFRKRLIDGHIKSILSFSESIGAKPTMHGYDLKLAMEYIAAEAKQIRDAINGL